MKPVWTDDQVVAQLTHWGGRWNNSVPVPFMFYTQWLPHHQYKTGFAAFTEAERQSLLLTMQLVSDVANISFVNIASTAQWPSASNPFMGFYTINQASAAFWGAATRYVTDGSGPPEPMGRIYGVDIVVNHYRADVQGGWSVGDSNSRKLMHELLHGVGLAHAGDYNGDSATSYETHASYYQDSNQYTVMSYWGAHNTGANHYAGGVLQFASTPLLYDVAALQALYGANMSTRTGDTVYGFNNTSGRAAFDLQRDPSAVFTIWDAGGRDTLDLSGFSSSSLINLHHGGFSDAGGLTDNISIALGARIENAVGGTGNDILIANEVQNRLSGGGGGDTFTFTEGDAQVGWLRSDGKKVMPDMIADFVSGQDRIDLSAIDAISASEANDAFTWIGAAAFSNQAGQLRAVATDSQIQIEGDTDGNGVADLIILVSSPVIAAGDLVF
jgi:serralysin